MVDYKELYLRLWHETEEILERLQKLERELNEILLRQAEDEEK